MGTGNRKFRWNKGYSMSTLILDNKDKKLRKRWLYVTLYQFIFFPIVWLGFMALLSLWFPVNLVNLCQIMLPLAFVGVLQSCVLLGLSYYKHGTILLTLALIVGPFQYIASTLSILQEPCNVLTYIAILVDTVMYAWWYGLSFKLRELNKKIRVTRIS